MLSLSITGFHPDPDRVTDILGIAPTSVARKGDLRPSGRAFDFNGWWVEVHPAKLTEGQTHSVGLAQIINLLRGRAAAFATLWTELQPRAVTIYGGLYHQGDEQCGIWLDPEDMGILAECGIGWGLDIHSE
ncbi:MAG: DUF4279 domain-containing protein [Porphyrobacter sp.]|nr:DUF4279 domain-containing protein [Porphyrobacter sp.]